MGTYRQYTNAIDANAEGFVGPCRFNPALAVPPACANPFFANDIDDILAPEFRDPLAGRCAQARIRACSPFPGRVNLNNAPNGRYVVSRRRQSYGPAGYRSQYEAAAYSGCPSYRPACIDNWETYPYPYQPRNPLLPPLAVSALDNPRYNYPPYRFGRGYPPCNCYAEYRAGCYCPPPVVEFNENPFAPVTPYPYDPFNADYRYRTPCDL